MTIAIKKSSWHYKLHTFIRSIWGLNPSPAEKWSLCPYFQTTVWGSFFTLLFIPFVIIGWTYCKFLRICYKTGNKFKMLKFIPYFIDTFRIRSAILDNAHHDFKHNPMISGLKWSAFFVLDVIIACITVVCAIIIYHAITNDIDSILDGAISLILLLGSGIFACFSFLWVVIAFIGNCLVESFHFVGKIFSYIINTASKGEFWSGLGTVVGIMAVSFLAIWFISVVFMSVIASAPAQNAYKYLSMQANGYIEARQKREKEQAIKARKERLEKERLEAERVLAFIETGNNIPLKKDYVTSHKPSISDTIGFIVVEVSDLAFELTKKTFHGIKSLYAHNKTIYEEDKSGFRSKRVVQVLGPIGIFVKFLVSAKKGICPILEFIEDDNTNKIK